MSNRVMYLRDAKGLPVGCVAIRVSRGNRLSLVDYQISVLNPKDKFDRAVARDIALGRLAKKPLEVPVSLDPSMHQVTEAVMIDIAEYEGSPGRAVRAALLWLKNNRPSIETSLVG
jgi:hypothetical protein